MGDAYRLYLTDLVLIGLTFGIYTIWHQCNVRRFRLRHTRMGDVGFDYRGNGAELFGISLSGGILSYLTLGIYLPWHIARLLRFHMENTTFRRHAFQSRLTGGQVLSVGAPAILAIILTLGLAIPWALNRWYRLVTNTTSYPGPIDLDELRSIHDESAGAMLEGVGEAGDAIAEIGELFGG